ncbi:hypothetical protein JX265_007824 [Neoarthrinium moseri]|uniref:Uncharacterized protein n=1 Tax=Neoarthrinium moseri TaxID=1658444 RepID=A0A9P9WJE6_9PEZI|nr:hypothetical protein JX265_007824 [Neoarthrinium moseri]
METRSAKTVDPHLQGLLDLCAPYDPYQNKYKMPEVHPTVWADHISSTAFQINTKQLSAMRAMQNALDNRRIPMEWFRLSYHRLALISTAAVLLDQERSTVVHQFTDTGGIPRLDPREPHPAGYEYSLGRRCVPPVIEHMLLLDYGIDNRPLDLHWYQCPIRSGFNKMCHAITRFALCCRDGKFPTRNETDAFSSALAYFRFDEHIAELATTLHWFCTHRGPISDIDYRRGWTGYIGVLQEMVSDIPTQGVDRLEYKLSMDINIMISKCVRTEQSREKMYARASSLAARHNISVPSSVEAHDRRFHQHIPQGGSVLAVEKGQKTAVEAPPSYEEAMKSE